MKDDYNELSIVWLLRIFHDGVFSNFICRSDKTVNTVMRKLHLSKELSWNLKNLLTKKSHSDARRGSQRVMDILISLWFSTFVLQNIKSLSWWTCHLIIACFLDNWFYQMMFCLLYCVFLWWLFTWQHHNLAIKKQKNLLHTSVLTSVSR